MARNFLSIKSLHLTLAILLVNIYQYYCYTPPAATVEPLHPVGLRISIPGKIITFKNVIHS